MAIARLSNYTLRNGLVRTSNIWDEVSKGADPFGLGNIRGYFPFNGNSTDSSGNITFFENLNVTYGAGLNGQAAYFNGSNSGLRASNYAINTGNGARSISLWAYISSATAVPTRMMLVGNGAFGAANGRNFDLEAHVYKSTKTATGQISWNYGIHYWGDGLEFQNSPVLYNQWVHLVAVHDGGNLSQANTRLYVNGESPRSLETSNIAFDTTSTSELHIGRRYRNDILAYDMPLNGRIEQLRMFNTALNAQQVAYLFNNGVSL